MARTFGLVLFLLGTPRFAHAQQPAPDGGLSLQSTFSVVVSNEDFFGEKNQAYLQYELSVPIRTGAHLVLAPTLLYIRGLSQPVVRQQRIGELDNPFVDVETFRAAPFRALALGVQVRRSFGRAALRPFAGVQGFVLSNAIDRDGFLVGVRGGGAYAAGSALQIGLEAQLNAKLIPSSVWPMLALGTTVRYRL
jgi:hypothetical protein